MDTHKRTYKPLPGLRPNAFSLPNRRLAEIDYEDKLDSSEKDWISRFNREFAQCFYEKDGKDIIHPIDVMRKQDGRDKKRRGKDVHTLLDYRESRQTPEDAEKTVRGRYNYDLDAFNSDYDFEDAFHDKLIAEGRLK